MVEDGLVGSEGERGGVRRGKGVPERLAMLVSVYDGGEVRGCVWFGGDCWVGGVRWGEALADDAWIQEINSRHHSLITKSTEEKYDLGDIYSHLRNSQFTL